MKKIVVICCHLFISLFYNSLSSSENIKLKTDSLISVINKKDERIYEYKQKIEKSAEQNSVRNIMLVVFTLLVAIFFLLYNKHQLKLNNKYHSTINKQQNELFTTIISLQDKERKRIAEDLHDSLGSLLSTAKLQLARMEEENLILTNEQKTNYEETLSLLDDSIVELRNISHNIMPATLSKLGLVATLNNLFDAISSNTDITINFDTHDLNDRLNETHEISIYRIVLELINNIVKHANAKEINIQLIKYPDYLNISVEDDGCGFNYENTIKNNGGIGLTNISSRVGYMNGKLLVDSSLGLGTTVLIDIPIL